MEASGEGEALLLLATTNLALGMGDAVKEKRKQGRASVSYRSVEAGDRDQIVALHKECFPIDYEESFFRSIMAGKLYFALVAVDGDKVVGMITAALCDEDDAQDRGIVAGRFCPFGRAQGLVYILTLGVTETYRGGGIAKELLQRLVNEATQQSFVKAVYLHVLSTNRAAINFYEQNAFEQLQFLKDYYTFHKATHDAYVYVLYINGGKPPLQWQDIMACCTKTLWALQAGPAYCLSCFYYYLLSDGSSFPSLRDKDVEKIT